MKKDEPSGSVTLRWDERLFLGMYRLGMDLFFPPVLLALSPVLLFKRKRRITLLPRLGFQRFPKASPLQDARVPGRKKVLWVHALSVGEVLSAVPLIRELHLRIQPARIYFSASTLSGYETAKRKMEGTLDGLVFFPLDTFFAVRRCVANVQPSLFVLVETDLWPGFMAELRRQRIPSLLVNARLSPSSFKRYGQTKRLFSPALNTFCRVYPQSPADARSFEALGLNPEKLAEPGNLKFDAARTSSVPAGVERARAKVAVQEGERVLVAGSTHEGEEVILRTTFLRLRQSLPELKLIVAPRHPHRAEEVRRVFVHDPLKIVLYSSLPQKRFDVAVVDDFGVLSSLYEIGDLAYVGGSLVPKGGQNPLEPAAAGKPVLFGPNMSDFSDVAGCMLKEGGAIEVKDGEDLATQAHRLLSDRALRAGLGAKNKALVERNAGLATRIAEDILEFLQRG
ncbi:MAG: 3-deoxy-D-manno-octulosonic acid transferase [Deltaproteobacteria bacterium]